MDDGVDFCSCLTGVLLRRDCVSLFPDSEIVSIIANSSSETKKSLFEIPEVNLMEFGFN